MAVIERSKGTYTIEIHLGRYSNGKQKRYTETFHCSKKSEALAREVELKAQFKRGDLTQVKKVTFESFIKLWLEEYAEKNLGDKTVYRYKELLNSRIIPSLGHIKLDKLIPTDILMFENDLRDKGSRKDGKEKGLSETTVLHHHRLMSTILEAAVKWGYISNNPARKIDKPKNIDTDIEYLTLEEIQRFVKALESEELKYQALIMLALETGVRRGEIMALTWEDINFDNNTIKINKSLQCIPKTERTIKSPKTKSSYRTITISSNVISLLKSFKIKQSKDKLKLGDKWKNINRVFTSSDGSTMHPDTVTHFVPKFIKSYNDKISKNEKYTDQEKEALYLPRITFHGLRHSNATLLISQNINMKTVSSRLGHANISTTLDIYTKALKSSDKDVADKMDSLLTLNSKRLG